MGAGWIVEVEVEVIVCGGWISALGTPCTVGYQIKYPLMGILERHIRSKEQKRTKLNRHTNGIQ